MTKQIETKTRIYIFLSILILWFLNIYLIMIINNTRHISNNLTYEDWVILYKFCDLRTWPKLKTIVNVYWNKQTDFKNFLLKQYEN